MYLAPLNYDLFFRKVFSHLHITKAFLEDFLETEVEEIELLPTSHFLTDTSAKMTFDFRCKIKGKYIVIEMQQWYKQDVIKHFYLYHCASTVLQLEYLKSKRLVPKNEENKTRDYDYKHIVPVLTLIWMASDQLEYDGNFATFIMNHEEATSFLEDDTFWDKASKPKLLEKRREVLKLLRNEHKEISFLKQNRLVFMFQKNIVKSINTKKRYKKWFDFAAKTLNQENEASDFEDFTDSKVFKDIMRLIGKDYLNDEEMYYLETEDETKEMHQRYLDGVREDAIAEGLEMGIEKGIEKGIETMVLSFHKQGVAMEVICAATHLSKEKVNDILAKNKEHF
ncbi:MAG: hypothetical protein ACKVTZ_18920 [Bacteroidia bacterium]